METNWPKVLGFIYLHTGAAYGFFLVLTQAQITTTLFSIFLISLGTLSLTTGCHRLWAHRSYEATSSLRLALALLHTLVCHTRFEVLFLFFSMGNYLQMVYAVLVISCCSAEVTHTEEEEQHLETHLWFKKGPIYNWVLEHRVHHKYHGTDSDRNNYKKGFLYCHLSSRCAVYNPKHKELEKEIDMSDIEADEIVMFQKKFYWLIMPVVSFLLPLWLTVYRWDEGFFTSAFVTCVLRTTILYHASWLINSGFLLWGLDPLDKRSSDTNLVFFVTKSLWPQYHYLLPWDYKSGEYGTYGSGCSTAFIRVFAALGLANNLKTIEVKGIQSALAVSAKTGKPVLECLYEAKTICGMTDVLNHAK